MAFYNRSSRERVADILAAINLIPPRYLKRERELLNTKWFAYRFMSPLAATKHFADVYRAGVQAYAHKHRDRDLAERVQGLSQDVFSEPSGSLTELWSARQRADELGLPYDQLVGFGMYFAGRRKWRNTPRPIQLFGSKHSDVAWPLELEKFLLDRYPDALDRLEDLPQYRTENYRGLPPQDELRATLLEQIDELNKPWSVVIGRYCIETRHLPLRSTLKLVPVEKRHGILSDIRHDRNVGIISPAPVEQLPLIAYVPGCFGMPHAHDLTSDPCANCVMGERCGSVASDVTRRMLDRYGVISPLQSVRDNRRREKTRLRVARYRAKKSEPEPLRPAAP